MNYSLLEVKTMIMNLPTYTFFDIVYVILSKKNCVVNVDVVMFVD